MTPPPLPLTRPFGVFGGTFDPPHLGHLILAAEALHQLSLERVLWVLTPNPPHKPGQVITPVEHRLAMLEAMLAETPAFEVSYVDINRPAPHYAVDTVRLLRSHYPGQDIVYLMGGDSLRNLPSWRHPQAFVAACDAIGVMRRPGTRLDLGGVETRLIGLGARLRFVDTPLLEISSQEIRRRMEAGAPFRYFLHPAVYQLILSRQYYR